MLECERANNSFDSSTRPERVAIVGFGGPISDRPSQTLYVGSLHWLPRQEPFQSSRPLESEGYRTKSGAQRLATLMPLSPRQTAHSGQDV